MKKPVIGLTGFRDNVQVEDNTYRGLDGVMRRVPEKISEPKPEPEPKRQHAMDIFLGKRIVIQRGPAIYTGKLEAITARWSILSNATIIGTNRTVEVPEAYVNNEIGGIQHVHPDN